MRWLDGGPESPRGWVPMFEEGRDAHCPLLARDEQLGRHSDAGVRPQQHGVGGAATHFPAEHGSLRWNRVELEPERQPTAPQAVAHWRRGVLENRSRPLLRRADMRRTEPDGERVLVVDTRERQRARATAGTATWRARRGALPRGAFAGLDASALRLTRFVKALPACAELIGSHRVADRELALHCLSQRHGA